MISVNENPYFSYVTTSSQKRYSTYTSAPSATIEPTINRSERPWNGSAGQFGAETGVSPWDVVDPATGKAVLLVVGAIAVVLIMSAFSDNTKPSRSWATVTQIGPRRSR